jgi:hypothetical protein
VAEEHSELVNKEALVIGNKLALLKRFGFKNNESGFKHNIKEKMIASKLYAHSTYKFVI